MRSFFRGETVRSSQNFRAQNASLKKRKTRREKRRVWKVTESAGLAAAHFCHVRFLWRLAFKRFLRLCLFILRRRFFLRLPMDYVERVQKSARLRAL